MNDVKDRLKGGIDNAANQAKQATDDAANAGHGFADRVKGTAQPVIDRVKDNAQYVYDKAGEAKDAVRGFVGHDAPEAVAHAGEKAQQWAGEACDVTGQALSDVSKDVTALVRKHPLPALAIGFGLGLLLGRVGRMV